MRRIIATLAAAGAMFGGGYGVAALTAGTAAVVAPAVAASAPAYHGQSVPRTHPNGTKLYNAQPVPRTHPNGKKLYTTIQVGSSWSGVKPAGKKF